MQVDISIFCNCEPFYQTCLLLEGEPKYPDSVTIRKGFNFNSSIQRTRFEGVYKRIPMKMFEERPVWKQETSDENFLFFSG